MIRPLDLPPVLVVRLDATGDVLLAGPAVRAAAASGRPVDLLAGPRGREAGRLLPCVRDVQVWAAPWIEAEPPPVTSASCQALVDAVAERGYTDALVLTSFHQSPLPLALLLRLAGVGRISAISDDYPGSLLDVRVPDPGDVPEDERALAVAAAAGFPLPQNDSRRLAVRRPLPDVGRLVGRPGYVVLHPGTSVPARAWPAERWRELASLLRRAGRRVVVSGSRGERALTGSVAVGGATDLGGRTSLAELASVMAGADVVVAANTGPAHLAAAVGTPVVSLFAPTVPAARWAPQSACAVLGDQAAACAGTRATVCPVPGHPCLASVTAADVVGALEQAVAA